ncbi:MAG: hypothetical protein QGD89_05750 [Actinomycetota bacterium]|nr:hypothetical protein [Actinomycetota bacterium]
MSEGRTKQKLSPRTRQLRNDFRYRVSAGLVLATVITVFTALVAETSGLEVIEDTLEEIYEFAG